MQPQTVTEFPQCFSVFPIVQSLRVFSSSFNLYDPLCLGPNTNKRPYEQKRLTFASSIKIICFQSKGPNLVRFGKNLDELEYSQVKEDVFLSPSHKPSNL